MPTGRPWPRGGLSPRWRWRMPPKTRPEEPDDGSLPSATDVPVSEHPLVDLERLLILEYLRNKGYSLDRLRGLPPEESATLMKEASCYASAKLAELESRALFVEEVHKAAAP